MKYLLSANAKNSLIGYYEICGKYSKSGRFDFCNWLNPETTGNRQWNFILQTGFCLKAMKKFENGNLNREEVQNAINELKSFHKDECRVII